MFYCISISYLPINLFFFIFLKFQLQFTSYSILYLFQVRSTVVRQSRASQSGLPIRQVPTWPHSWLLWYYWLCSLCCHLLPHDYSVTTNLYLIIPSPLYPVPQLSSLLTTISLFSVSVSLFLFCSFCSLDSTYNETIWYLSFSDLLHLA